MLRTHLATDAPASMMSALHGAGYRIILDVVTTTQPKAAIGPRCHCAASTRCYYKLSPEGSSLLYGLYRLWQFA